MQNLYPPLKVISRLLLSKSSGPKVIIISGFHCIFTVFINVCVRAYMYAYVRSYKCYVYRTHMCMHMCLCTDVCSMYRGPVYVCMFIYYVHVCLDMYVGSICVCVRVQRFQRISSSYKFFLFNGLSSCCLAITFRLNLYVCFGNPSLLR